MSTVMMGTADAIEAALEASEAEFLASQDVTYTYHAPLNWWVEYNALGSWFDMRREFGDPHVFGGLEWPLNDEIRATPTFIESSPYL